MSWKIKIIENPGYIKLQYSGLVTKDELVEAFFSTAGILRGGNILKVLADCTSMTGGHSVTDLYGLIDLFEAAGMPRNIKEAIILPELKDTLENVRFYETACLNRGYNVKICREHDEAVKWLFS